MSEECSILDGLEMRQNFALGGPDGQAVWGFVLVVRVASTTEWWSMPVPGGTPSVGLHPRKRRLRSSSAASDSGLSGQRVPLLLDELVAGLDSDFV